MHQSSKIAKAFNRAAHSYDETAVLQHEVGRRLLERLRYVKLEPKRILDLGAGTGTTTRLLAKHFPKAEIIHFDISERMLTVNKSSLSFKQRWRDNQKFICGDMGALPFAEGCFDLVFSNLTIQWHPDYNGLFKALRKLMKPNALFVFTTLGPDTLSQLKQCWQALDGYPHVNEFIDMHIIGDSLLASQFNDPVIEREEIILTYPGVKKLLKDLKDIGSSNKMENKRTTLMTKSLLTSLESEYEKYRTDTGVLPLTYEVIYGHAWNQLSTTTSSFAPEISIPIQEIGKINHD